MSLPKVAYRRFMVPLHLEVGSQFKVSMASCATCAELGREREMTSSGESGG